MFSNVGKKMQTLAIVTCFIGMGAAIVAGAALIGTGQTWNGIAVLLFGPVAAWIASWGMIGFGRIVSFCEMQEEKELSRQIREEQARARQQEMRNRPAPQRKPLVTAPPKPAQSQAGRDASVTRLKKAAFIPDMEQAESMKEIYEKWKESGLGVLYPDVSRLIRNALVKEVAPESEYGPTQLQADKAEIERILESRPGKNIRS